MGEILKTAWETVLIFPFLNLLFFLYHILWSNMGLAVIMIGVLSRLALIPISKKMMQNTEKMQQLKPRLDEIQKKYANNQEKLAKEQLKLYKEMGYNPLGCFGSFSIQIVILIAVVNVIRIITSTDFTNEFTGIYPFLRDWIVGSNGKYVINSNFFGIDLMKNFNEMISSIESIPFEGILFNIPYTIASFFIAPFKLPQSISCLLYTSPSPRDRTRSRMPSSA